MKQAAKRPASYRSVAVVVQLFVAWVRTHFAIVSSRGLRVAESSIASNSLVGYFVVSGSCDQTVPLEFSELYRPGLPANEFQEET
jgi:hypothetical protein